MVKTHESYYCISLQRIINLDLKYRFLAMPQIAVLQLRRVLQKFFGNDFPYFFMPNICRDSSLHVQMSKRNSCSK